jgi:Domain of unknown function (DUF6968)
VDVSLGNVIALRTLHWVPDDGTRPTVSFAVGTPQKSPYDDIGVIVPFQITGIGPGKVKFAAGVDGIQAFLLALKMLGADLDRIQTERNGRLAWLGDESGTCGLNDR